ncbi:hypothetical protein [Noviherbaspirillum cavernae]|uniref:hypothetical protein n=1 Tax=Noviherbaspirillum cavernae TaxID=2320862 RepID=UPI0013144E66|nr:hypothetical protein [Noviherbaspirillum cavernae]
MVMMMQGIDMIARFMPLIRMFAGMVFMLQAVACAHAHSEKKNAPESRGEQVQKEKPATDKPVAPRRAVPQNIERSAMPPAPPIRIPSPPPPPSVQQPVTPAPPSPVTTCDAGGCWSPGGTRYQGGAGGTYLDNSGRLCQRNGVWMQCF